MDASRLAVTTAPLEHDALVRMLTGATGSVDEGRHGAIVSFLGTVRSENAGRRVLRLEYEAYEPLALCVFQRIAGEVRESWPSVDMALHHRIGSLVVGDVSVVIVTASPHRAQAFAACSYVIERVKQIAPIWKHEYFEDGDVWIEGASADPDDERARETAHRRVCA